MRYLTVCRSQNSARSNDQKDIPSNYLERDDFDLSIPFHGGLHYAFVKNTPTASYSKGYELRTAINDFLDFAALHNARTAASLQVYQVTDIGVEEYKLFEDYLRRNGKSPRIAVRLKSALKKAALLFEDGFPLLALPLIEVGSGTPYEPLSDEADRELIKELSVRVDLLRDKLAYQKSVYVATPYDKSEVVEITRELYSLQRGEASSWVIDPARAQATLLQYGVSGRLSACQFQCLRVDAKSDALSTLGRKPVEFVLSCCLPEGYLRKKAPSCISFLELSKKYYPTNEDQVVLALYVQRKNSWNKESVLAADRNKFVHPLSVVVKSKNVILQSRKLKSQGKGLAYVRPKIVHAHSNSADPYSAHNLLVLADQLSKPCREGLSWVKNLPADDKRKQSPFLFIMTAHAKFTTPNRQFPEQFESLDNQRQWNDGVQKFLAQAKIYDRGVLLKTGADIQGRLRVTGAQRLKKVDNFPTELTSLILGHKSVVTTDVHYDSSVYAMADRRARFHAFQESLISRLQDGQFQGYLGHTGAPKPKGARFRIFTVLGHERALWACMDSTRPEFPGHEKLVLGARCTRLDKCHGCKQVYILGDSLPFLMERRATIELQIERDESVSSSYADELKVLQYLIDQWGDESAIVDARKYMRQFEALLPLDLKSLIAYIED